MKTKKDKKEKKAKAKNKAEQKQRRQTASEYDRIDFTSEIKRLNRVMGQVDGVRRMLEDQRKLDDVLIQCKAIRCALKSVETRILKAHLEVALDDIILLEKKKNREQRVAELEELFKQAS